MVTENIFEARFMFVNEMVRLGAEIRTDGHHAVIRGRPHLSGAPVKSHRHPCWGQGSAPAPLLAEGETIVTDAHHIDRGYAGFVEQPQQPWRRDHPGNPTFSRTSFFVSL